MGTLRIQSMLEPNLAQWYHHNIDPIAFQWGEAAIPWYWLVYLLGWIWCAGIFHYTFQGTVATHEVTANKNTPLSLSTRYHKAQNDFLLWGWIGLILGARFIYIFAYNFKYFVENPDQILALWNGGMSFHGGFLGIAVAAYLVARRNQISLLMLTDPIAAGIPWILALGRLANFANGELVGRVSTVSWAVIFPPPFDGAPRHPSQLYEAVFEGILLGLFLLAKYPMYSKRPGFLSFSFVGFYAAVRFFVEYTREPDAQLGLIAGLSMGQWLSLIMIGFAIYGFSKMAPKQN